MKINDKKMLVYGFKEAELKVLSDILNENNLPPYAIIEKSMRKMKVKFILLAAKHDPVSDADENEEKVVLFNNIVDLELNNVIDQIRRRIGHGPIMAVVTKNSSEWTFEELLNHLVQEREWYKKNKIANAQK